ncbi:hypothetical protein COEREDRAFT_9795 [Coemansia reversa NRRL 1564]|uniref:Uncharacterized protein n=1 Tax=Coemansia reversa (strain ATCC 12441 / NRRL 1564) TaxID=763665 RepID=A0A2G5B7F4_COERN|nr:hypothetical protein COEREDRAFT_9795 [Coemansia reversa NRRL 1564]|eukprot:PIA14931.1 hypothetical protein COEREDRAFT_9795 [Coemansia reversa NRRL 1564]
MKFSDASFRIGRTVVLAYPDITRAAGFRAALALWTKLAGSGPANTTVCTASLSFKPTEILLPRDVPEISVAYKRDETGSVDEIPVVFATSGSHPEVTFCFVSGLPATEHIPELVDGLITLFEQHNVESLVVPVAADVSCAGKESKFWVQYPTAPMVSSKLQGPLAELKQLPKGAETADTFFSVLSNIMSASTVGDVALLIHADKRPAGSRYQQNVVFGTEYSDTSDAGIVRTLVRALSAATGITGTTSFTAELISAVTERVRLDVDQLAKTLGTFG